MIWSHNFRLDIQSQRNSQPETQYAQQFCAAVSSREVAITVGKTYPEKASRKKCQKLSHDDTERCTAPTQLKGWDWVLEIHSIKDGKDDSITQKRYVYRNKILAYIIQLVTITYHRGYTFVF